MRYSPFSIIHPTTLHHRSVRRRRAAYLSTISRHDDGGCEDDDDDSSTSSTLTTNRSHDDKNDSQPKPRLERKRVRFDESQNVEYENYFMYQEECLALWYGGRDLYFFEESYLAHAKMIMHFDKTFTWLLRCTYQACCRQAANNKNDKMMNDERVALPFHEVYYCLKQFLNDDQATDRLGMEQTIVRENAHDLYFRRGLMNRIVSEIQEMEVEINDSHTSNEDAKAEFMRSNCEALSRPSRLYAQLLAKAQQQGAA